MARALLGELLGTMTLIIFGSGVVAGVLLNRSKAQNSGWIVIITGWFVGVVAGVFVATAFGSPDAHLNPAVTLCFAILKGDFSKLLPYTLAQTAGAFLGATVIWLHYFPHWKESSDPAAKLGVFSTIPAIRDYPWNLAAETIATVVLMVGIYAVNAGTVAPAVGPYLVGLLVWGIGASLGGCTGYAINPARDIGPRIAHAVWPIAGKGSSDWAYAWVPVVGPLAGGLLGAVFIKLLA
ncbi:MAG: aquaporin family protein [Elusimicrobia bacterium]|nr:aquaporin family protein [Elusimicrobiota bacterium]